MNTFARTFWLLLLSLLATVASAQNTAAPKKADPEDFGIVINQTLTLRGQEFYRRFTDFWRERSDFESYTLVIVELPNRRFGNRVVVYYKQGAVYVGNLPTRLDAIRDLSSEAAEKAYASIISLNLRVQGQTDPDMANEEL